MDLSISIKQAQQLSPQMMQSMAVLQMNAQELLEYIDNVVQENPVLEAEPPAPESDAAADLQRKLQWLESTDVQNRFYHRHDRNDAVDPMATLPDGTESENLYHYVLSQLPHLGLREPIRSAARYLVESLDSSGWLDEEISDIARLLGLTHEQAEEALRVVQSLDPAGIGARGLSECLVLQLLRRTGDHSLAISIAEKHLDALGKNRYSAMARALDTTVDEVCAACDLIRTLNPRPGTGFAAREHLLYINPDVFVVNFPTHFELLTNDYFFPSLTLNRYYCRLLRENQEKEVGDYLQEKVRQAKWVVRSIDQRRRTLLSCVERIVEAQEPFFRGGGRLIPLTMAEIAERLGVHESTVSRAVKGKYLQCVTGVYPLNYFFSRGLGCPSVGGGISPHDAKSTLKDLIAGEDGAKPLSDQTLCKLMQGRGIDISRRTVAKYRDELRIPNAAGRRRTEK